MYGSLVYQTETLMSTHNTELEGDVNGQFLNTNLSSKVNV